MIFVVLVVLLLAAVGVIYFAMRTPGQDVSGRLAAIDASAGLSNDATASVFQKLLDEQRRDKLENRLQEAGWYDMTPAKLLAKSGMNGAVGAGFGFLIILALHQIHFAGAFGTVGFGMLALCAGYGFYSPYAQLSAAIKKRKIEIRRALPDFLDVLGTTVEAGVALNQAIAFAVEGMQNALGDELRTALQDVRLGRSRAEALTAMAVRIREPEITTVVTALVQSERVGAAVTGVIDELAADSRDRRIMRAEELAAQLGNKLIFPMALTMLPSLFIMIFGGVFARYFHGLH
jgi:tight adherence protein C